MDNTGRGLFEGLTGAFLIALIGTLLARWTLLGSVMEFLRAHIEAPELAVTLATLLFGVLLFGFVMLIGRIATFELERPSDQIRVRHGKGVLFLDAASVCDQVFIATSKVQGVRCSEVEVHGIKGDAHIALHAQIESAAELQAKHAELRQAIQEMARRLHIRLGAEPIIHAKLPPLRGARTVDEAVHFRGIFSTVARRPESSRTSDRPSIFGVQRDSPNTIAPSSLDGEAPPRPSSSIFGLFRPSKPDEPDDEQ